MAPGAGPRASRVLGLLTAGFLFWALVLLARLVQIQWIRHPEYAEAARRQHVRELPLPAPRGSILDRNGSLLAASLALESVSVDPRYIPSPEEAARLFSQTLGLPYGPLRDKLAELQRRRAGFVYIKRRLSPEESRRLRALGKSWIQLTPEVVRHYPKGKLAAHLIGTVDFEQKGALGLELAFDGTVGGKHGAVKVVSDVWRRLVQPVAYEAPQPGSSLALTVDERIQYVAEQELEAAARAEGCSSGSVVVMNPHTGELLAVATYPGFDPNVPPRDPDEARIRFHNYAVSVPFEPGSVFKVVTLTAALETTDLRPETIVNCGNGRIALYGRVVHDHHPYSALSVADVLAKSSNIGAIQIGLKVGERRLYEYVRKFGFGQRTGLPLPAESPGRVRPLERWQKTSLPSVAMGHELSATTIQLARAVSVIANGGLLVKPRIVLWRQRPDGVIEREPAEKPVRVLKPETAFLMRRLMEGVVLHGTGRAARLDGYSAAGKTGTAQIYDPVARRYTHFYNASFVGFAPVTEPAIVVAVTLNGARRYGGEVAAPVFRKVAMTALQLMNVPKDIPETAPTGPMDLDADANDVAISDFSQGPEPEVPEAPPPPAESPSARLVAGLSVPDFQGLPLSAVLERALVLGLTVEAVGSGIAREQFPPPGSPLQPGGRLRVVFKP